MGSWGTVDKEQIMPDYGIHYPKQEKNESKENFEYYNKITEHVEERIKP